MKRSLLNIAGILVLTTVALFINHLTASYTCLEYDDVAQDGEIDCLDEGLTDNSKIRVLAIDLAIIGLGTVGTAITLLKRQRKSSNVTH